MPLTGVFTAIPIMAYSNTTRLIPPVYGDEKASSALAAATSAAAEGDQGKAASYFSEATAALGNGWSQATGAADGAWSSYTSACE